MGQVPIPRIAPRAAKPSDHQAWWALTQAVAADGELPLAVAACSTADSFGLPWRVDPHDPSAVEVCLQPKPGWRGKVRRRWYRPWRRSFTSLGSSYVTVHDRKPGGPPLPEGLPLAHDYSRY